MASKRNTATLPTRFLTAADVAELFGCPVRYIHRLTHEKRIRSYKVAGRLLFRHEDVAMFLESTVTEAETAPAYRPEDRRERRRSGRPRAT